MDTKKYGKLIVIAGPTAVGKSRAAVRLAQEIGGEVISADSMQVYRGMDIGTAKVTPEEMQGVPHHLIDILEPGEEFNAALFRQYAMDACERIYADGHVPIVCGGTGFYIQGLLYGIDFTAEEDKDAAYREELAALLEKHGAGYIFRMLEIQDPLTAAHIDGNNPRRVIRALEYYRLHGRSIYLHNVEEAAKRADAPFDYRFFVLTRRRENLYPAIEARVDGMMEDGLVAEARALFDAGPDPGSTAAQGIGYKELFAYFQGKCSLREAVDLIKRNSRRYAKRQLTWFRREASAVWIDVEAEDPVTRMLREL